MKFYPLKLKPVTKYIIWGGNYLEKTFGYKTEDDNIAEAWLTTCRPDGVNIIENGEAQGTLLDEYIKNAGKENIYGDFEDFPLLIKFIDANDKLSVQVHPDDKYAKANGLDAGKTEMWYIVDAKEGASLVYGLRDKVKPTAKELLDYNEKGLLAEKLNFVPVKKGDCFFIPAGLVHAIGEGIVIAEIQQNSNTTYRMYDYDRVGKDGKKRELHIEKAAEVIKTEFDGNFISGKKVSDSKEILCDCDLFLVEKYDLKDVTMNVAGGNMRSIICLDGDAFIECGNERYVLSKGDSYLIPKALGSFTIVSDKECEVIISSAK